MNNAHTKISSQKTNEELAQTLSKLRKDYLPLDNSRKNELINLIQEMTGKSKTEILTEIHRINNI